MAESTAELIRQAGEQITTLVRDELAQLRAEMAEKGKRAGVGVGLFGGAAVTLHFAVGALLVAAGLGLATVMPGWAAALIVGVVLLLAAGVEALVGRRQLKEAGSVLPTRTIESVRSDIDEVKTAVEGSRETTREERNRR